MSYTHTTERAETRRDRFSGWKPLPGRRSAALCAALSLMTAFACSDAPDAESAPPAHEAADAARPRALWVLAEGHERVLENPERVPVLIETAQRLDATDLFVQVYRGGRAWFDSSHADARPYVAARDASGRDPLADLLIQAHAAGLRVHAWVNVLSLARNVEAPVIEALGRSAVLVDRHGRSLLDYPNLDVPQPDRRYYRMGTPGIYLDPAAPGLASYLAETFSELLVRYPELDGLHLDYVRYPDVLPYAPGSRFGVGLDFGYGELTRARFLEETGVLAPFGDSLRNASRWDDWRREKLSELVASIAARARAVHPSTALSAAVWTYADRGYLVLGQDWRGWLDEGSLDFAVPMAYTLDDRLFGYLVDSFASGRFRDRIWVGMGSWLFAKHPERAIAQIRSVREAGASGEALFSYDSIVSEPALLDALLQEAEDAR